MAALSKPKKEVESKTEPEAESVETTVEEESSPEAEPAEKSVDASVEAEDSDEESPKKGLFCCCVGW